MVGASRHSYAAVTTSALDHREMDGTAASGTRLAGTCEVGFVIEQVLGHITHGQNLRRHVDDPDLRARWAMIPYDVDGVAARIPVYGSNWTVRVGLRTRRALRRLSRDAPFDALFFHTQVPAMLSLDWIRRIPTVISLDATPRQYDELGAFYQHESGGDRIERLKWRLTRSCLASARHIVTWADWTKQGLVSDYEVPPDKVTVVPPGVTVDEWSRPPRVAHDGPVKLLFVGGDLARKGGHVLLDAFRSLDGDPVELHIATRDAVPEQAGVIVHHGLQPNSPELRELYHSCDIFVLPTFGDCLPMVLSEAGAARMATVSTRVAAIPEVVLDGHTGLLVPPGDVAALADALRRLIERPEERIAMGERASAHIAEHFDTATNTRRLLEIVKRTVHTSGSSGSAWGSGATDR
jgi:glycosyltransferase involved in cell wall biosynthesis